MCNACGFVCCACDCFSQCGCDDCDNPACWGVCDECGEYDMECTCGDEYAEEEAVATSPPVIRPD